MPSPGIGPGPRPSQGRVRIRHTPRTMFMLQYLAEESNLVLQIRSLPCSSVHTRKAQVARPGIEPGLAASEAGVRSGTLTGQIFQYLDLESNQDLNLRTVPCVPLHHRDMEPTAGFAPA